VPNLPSQICGDTIPPHLSVGDSKLGINHFGIPVGKK
jgi:hypothetical protein